MTTMISPLRRAALVAPDGPSLVCDGEEQTYTLLRAPTLDGKPATLEGLVGKVRGGYKFFPARTLADMHLDVQFDEKP